MTLKHKRVYNFVLKGGKPFGIQPRGNPPLEHNGIKTIDQLILTEDEFDEVVKTFEEHEVEWEENDPLPPEEKQKIREEQKRMASITPDDLPTHKCQTCALFEPSGETFCAVEAWAPDQVQHFVTINANAKVDLMDCPLEKQVPNGNSDRTRDS